MFSWGKFWIRRCKKTKPTNCGNENRVLGTKAGYCSCPLHKPPPPKRWAKHQATPPVQPLTPYKQPTHQFPPREQAREAYMFSLPSAATGAPVKLCLNFLTGLLSISSNWRRPRTLVGINTLLNEYIKNEFLSEKCPCNFVSHTTNRTRAYCIRNLLCSAVLPSVQIMCVSVCNWKNSSLSFHL